MEAFWRGLIPGVILLCTPAFSPAQGVQIFGAEKPIPEFSYAELSVKLEKDDSASWIIFPVPVKKTDRGDGLVQFSGPPGTVYTVFVTVVNFSAKKLTTSQTTVTMDGKKPEPDVPIDPDDPTAATLISQLKAVFAAEEELDKPLVPNLVAVYNQAGTLVLTATTWGELWTGMVAVAKAQKINGRLLLVDAVIQKYLKKHLPSGEVGDTKITPGDATKAKNAFKTVATALGKINN